MVGGTGDEDISTTDITIPPILIQGPITRSRAHQLKQQVNSFLCSSSCENENRLLPNDVLVLRNEGEGHGVLMEHQLQLPWNINCSFRTQWNVARVVLTFRKVSGNGRNPNGDGVRSRTIVGS